MKPRWANQRNQAMTSFEVGVIIAVLLILVALLLPILSRDRRRVSRINCVNNLHQINLAYKIWEGDHSDNFPMGVSVTNGGSMELVVTGNVVETFVLMSNELSTPRILVCPTDTNRIAAWSFGGLAAGSNVSYFVGVDAANDLNPQVLLSGDDNLAARGVPVRSGLQLLATNVPVSWTAARHSFAGYIGLADGSVQSSTSSDLNWRFQQTGLATNRLAIP